MRCQLVFIFLWRFLINDDRLKRFINAIAPNISFILMELSSANATIQKYVAPMYPIIALPMTGLPMAKPRLKYKPMVLKTMAKQIYA